jgi:hypothetical protein
MARNQGMNEKDILGRIKNADPAANLEIDETLIEGSIASGNRKAKAARRRNSFFAAAGSGALALSVFASMSFGPSTQQSLITLGEGGEQGSQQGRLAASESVPGADSAISADKMMWINPYIYKYVSGSELSTQGSTGHVYKVELAGDPDVVLANLMKVFGVSGVTNQTIELGGESEGYQMLTAGAQDGTGKSINISWIGSGSWWYYDPSAYPQIECDETTEPEKGEAGCSSYIEQKPTPELVPTKAEATAEAIRIFKSVGFNVAAADVRVQSDQWGAWASAAVQLNGEDTPIEWSVSWSSTGKLSSVSGHSMKFVDKGEFKTISAKKAVERLTDWRYMGSIASSAYDKYFSQSPQVSPLGLPNTKNSGESDVSTGEIPAVEPNPTPSTVIIEITKAVKTHVMIWDATGNTWLVPGYIFIGDGSWISPVFSLEDGVVALPPKE